MNCELPLRQLDYGNDSPRYAVTRISGENGVIYVCLFHWEYLQKWGDRDARGGWLAQKGKMMSCLEAKRYTQYGAPLIETGAHRPCPLYTGTRGFTKTTDA